VYKFPAFRAITINTISHTIHLKDTFVSHKGLNAMSEWLTDCQL